MLQFVQFHAYWHQIAFLLLGCIVFGAGVAMEVTADVIVLPAEAVIKVISETYGHDFGKIKTIFDVTLCGLAIMISWLYFGQIRGVREGTVITDLFFAAKDGEALHSHQKQDQELTVAQTLNSLLPNSDLN